MNFYILEHDLIPVFSLCGNQGSSRRIQLSKENGKLSGVSSSRFGTSQMTQLLGPFSKLILVLQHPFRSWAPFLLSALQCLQLHMPSLLFKITSGDVPWIKAQGFHQSHSLGGNRDFFFFLLEINKSITVHFVKTPIQM